MSSNQPSDNRRIIVFDVNETLLDIDALSPYFQHVFGDAKIMRQWFAELILYSQTLSLSGKYVEFGELAVAVLAMVAKIKHAALSEASIDEFKQVLRYLPPHPEVAECLQRLRAAGFRLVTLTNSAPSASKAALERAGLASYVEQQFSVGEVKRYKPALETYSMVSHALHVPTSALRMVAAHAWDTFGAMAAGYRAALVTRVGNAQLLIGPQPDIIESELGNAVDKIIAMDTPYPA